MFIIKTETYKFPNNALEGQMFYDYFVDRYEWGGAEVVKESCDGMTALSISYIVETNEIEDFCKYKTERR